MLDALIPILIDILAELTQIRIMLTDDFDPVDVATDAVKIISSKKYLSNVINGVEIKEV